MAHTKNVPEEINVYISCSAINVKANSAALTNYAELLEEDGEQFCRVYGGSSHENLNYNEFDVYKNTSGSLVTGQYLVIKYRVGENGIGQSQFTIFAGTEHTNPTNETEHITLVPTGGVEDNKWHIAIIDMSTMAHNTNNDKGFLESNGTYSAKFIAIRPLYPNGGNRSEASDYTDVAFAAMCDSVEEAEALLGSGSYEYYTNSSTPTLVTID